MEQNYNAIDRAFAKLESEVAAEAAISKSYYVLVDCEFSSGQRLVKVVDGE
jgi:hypothetical protein